MYNLLKKILIQSFMSYCFIKLFEQSKTIFLKLYTCSPIKKALFNKTLGTAFQQILICYL